MSGPFTIPAHLIPWNHHELNKLHFVESVIDADVHRDVLASIYVDAGVIGGMYDTIYKLGLV